MRSVRVLCAVLFAAATLQPVPLRAKARRPDSPGQSTQKIDWIRNGIPKKIRAVQIKDDLYVSARDLSRLGGSQLRWRTVSDQACLSRIDGLLCLNWSRKRAIYNEQTDPKPVPLVYEDGRLFAPIRFVVSPTFQHFSHTKISYDSKNLILRQHYPVTLTFPPVQNREDRYRTAVVFGQKTPYRIIEMSDKRVWVRFMGGRFEKNQKFEGDSVIKEVKIIQRRRSADWIVEFGRKAGSHDVWFDRENRQLVVDVAKPGQAMAKSRSINAPLAAIPVNKGLSSLAVPPAKGETLTIVIDPGHGGMDSGAIGNRGTYEKDINLKIAKDLAEELRDKKIRVILTRDKDEFLTLAQRTRMADDIGADVFVSIHCNSSLSSKTKGFEAYILSPEASDEAAASVARLENSVVELEDGTGSQSKLTDLLASMAVYEFINESSAFAARLCLGVKRKSQVEKTAVREANFYVLRGAQMPGVLVELEYLSNPMSELKMRSSRWRRQVAKGLAAGIVDYLTLDLRKEPTVALKK